MKHLKITNGQPEIYSIGKLRSDKPQTSFPDNPSQELLATEGVYPYIVQDQPTVDYMTQTLTATAFAEIEGIWTQGWRVRNLSVEDAVRKIRSKRDNILSKTDWMALSDSTLTPEWSAYRKTLRDITLQTGFPYNVAWPTEPE